MNYTIVLFILLGVFAILGYLLFLLIKSLRKYINSEEIRREKKEMAKSLGDVLKEHRTECKMTQEFVAESVGVSRQAVSKWEGGLSDPNTTNLIALAKLYGTSPEEILKEARNN